MSLQQDYTGRDYLYGRLLAIAEEIEGMALYISGENRNTTAQRYMQQFANRPFSTWSTIELALDPYIQRLKNNRSGYIHNKQVLLSEVMDLFSIEDYTNDSALSGEFLLGFHCQKMQFYLEKKRKKESKSATTSTDSV